MPKSFGDILHFGLIRYRVVGSGNLFTTLRSLQDIDNQILSQYAMEDPNDREKTILSNFNKQRAQVDIRTLEIDEVFSLSRLVVFIKSVASGYPQ
jgi:hypothetical protein